MKTLFLVIFYSLLISCHVFEVKMSQAFELSVVNRSSIEIYPTISSRSSKERFGVVAIGGSATIGFSPFQMGDTIQIAWEEGESYDMIYVTLDTSTMMKIKNKVVMLHIIYLGNNKWIAKAFDKNNLEIGSIP